MPAPGSLTVLRDYERDGVMGTAVCHFGRSLLAVFDENWSPNLSQALATQQPPSGAAPTRGAILYDELSFEVGVVSAPTGVANVLGATAAPLRYGPRDAVALRWADCNGMIGSGCVRVVDGAGQVIWDVYGKRGGEELGIAMDSDGSYLAIGAPGRNGGRGEIEVYDLLGHSSWKVKNGQWKGLGRYLAIVEAPDETRLIAYIEHLGKPWIVELRMRGQLVNSFPIPEEWELVNIVSPMDGWRRTGADYALVFRDLAGNVFHMWAGVTLDKAPPS